MINPQPNPTQSTGPDLTSQFDNIWGTTTPTKAPTASGMTRADEIRNIANQSTQSDESQGTTQSGIPSESIFKPGVSTPAGKAILGFLSSATHGLQNVGKDIGQGIMGKTNQDTIQGYATNATTLTDLAAKQTDPALKQKYATMATQMLEDGRTPEQIVGDVLEAGVETAGALSLGLGAVDLAGAGSKVALEQGAKTFGQKVGEGAITGAKVGGGFGATQGAAEGLQNQGNINEVASSTITKGLEGAAGGAVIGGVAGAAPDVLSGIGEKLSSTPEKLSEQELSKIQETISPKLTAKEQQLAESQGRVVKGKEPGFFLSGKPDTVIPSDQVMKNSEIIQKNIPGAANMDEATLADELKIKSSEVAQELKPKLQEIPASGKSITKMNNDWANIKAQQSETPEFQDAPGSKAFQKQFETRLKEISSDSNLNDIWESAKSYDESVPENVKNATELSDAKLQYRKEMWLENRRIFKNAINDASDGLGKESKKAFEDMTAMYDSRENIISKAKVKVKGGPSKISKAANSLPGKVAIGVLGGGTALEAGKKLITGGY